MYRLFWSLLFLVACTPRPEHASSRNPASDADAAGPLPMTRILFIGNSYTYQNSLPEMVEAFARALVPGTPLETHGVLAGGATLRSHHAQGVAPQRIREGGWRFVVLQEQSLLGGVRIDGAAYVEDPDVTFFPAARQLAAQATSAGSRPLFYMTWSRKAQLAAQAPLTRAYARIADELGATLSPVGVAWERVRRERPGLELYAEDGQHPAPAGSYLSACVLFASIFQRPCTGAPGTLTGAPWTGSGFDASRAVTLVSLPEDTARYLQRVGSEVALAERLPESTDTGSARPPFPSLPGGTPLRPELLVGEWSGSLALYPSESGMAPAALRLLLTARGTELSGRARITIPRGEALEAAVLPKLEGDVVSLSFEDTTWLESTVHLRAVLKDGALHGVAQAEDPEGRRWYGSWAARLPSQGQPPKAPAR